MRQFKKVSKTVNIMKAGHQRSYFHIFLCMYIFCFLSCTKDEPYNEPIEYPEEILYLSGKYGSKAIYASNPNGIEARLVLIGEHDYTYARFSPEKEYIAVAEFLSTIFVPPIIFITDLDGNLIRMLTDNGVHPMWSPDGSKLLFARLLYFSSRYSNIFSIDASGNNENQMTDSTMELNTPLDWSGKDNLILSHEIKFWIDSAGTFNSNSGEIVLFTPEYNLRKYITQNRTADVFAQFSPSGDSIAYISGRYLNRDIFIYDMATEVSFNVTNHPDEYRTVIWSPDGKEIAYTLKVLSDNDLKIGSDIFIITLESGEIRVFTNSGNDSIFNVVTDWK